MRMYRWHAVPSWQGLYGILQDLFILCYSCCMFIYMEHSIFACFSALFLSVFTYYVSSHICRCLIKDFETRPSVMHLLEHPFIKQAHGKDTSLRHQLSVLIREQQDVGSRTRTTRYTNSTVLDDLSALLWNQIDVFRSHRETDCGTFKKRQSVKHHHWFYNSLPVVGCRFETVWGVFDSSQGQSKDLAALTIVRSLSCIHHCLL